MIHTIFCKGFSICPKCSGMLKTMNSDEIILWCFDCHTFYRAINYGQAEAELDFEEVTIGGDV